MKPCLLDTHYWLWFQTADANQLDRQARVELLDLQRAKSLFVSDVSVLEIARLTADGHIDLGMLVDRFVADAIADGGLRLLPLTTRILIECTRLPGKVHRDPADRMLLATAREHNLVLVTRDKDLLAYGRSGHVTVRKL